MAPQPRPRSRSRTPLRPCERCGLPCAERCPRACALYRVWQELEERRGAWSHETRDEVAEVISDLIAVVTVASRQARTA